MRSLLPITFVAVALFGLTACDKSAEDHRQDAAEHRSNAAEAQQQGDTGEAAAENAEAAKDNHEARVEDANKNRTSDAEVPR